MITHKKVSEIVKHWGLEKEPVSDIFREGNGERCEDAFFVGDEFVLKFTPDYNEMQNHITLAKSLEDIGLLTAVPVKTNSGEEYVSDEGIYFYLTRRIKGKTVTAQSFYTEDSAGNEESQARFIGEIVGQLSLALKSVQMQAKEIDLSKDISEWILPKGKELFPEYALFLQSKLNELKLLCDNNELPRQLIHRDPNPSNILMTDEQWGILDFDLAEWKAAPYVVLENQLACTIWFSQREQYRELYEINKKMTVWVIQHFDLLQFGED